MILVVSDIHGNVNALQAILEDAHSKYDIQQYAILGDMFALGPNPLEVYLEIEKLKDYFFIRGNHEDYLTEKFHIQNIGKIGNFERGSPLYEKIQTSLRRTYDALGSQRVDNITKMCIDEKHLIVNGITHYFCHGRPDTNKIGISNIEIEKQLEQFQEGCFWAGHVHHQLFTEIGQKKFINPGGSGLPFDEDHRAPYAVIDKDGRPILHRVAYSYQDVINKLNEYPDDLFAPILQKHLEFAKLVKHPFFG